MKTTLHYKVCVMELMKMVQKFTFRFHLIGNWKTNSKTSYYLFCIKTVSMPQNEQQRKITAKLEVVSFLFFKGFEPLCRNFSGSTRVCFQDGRLDPLLTREPSDLIPILLQGLERRGRRKLI